MNTSVIIMADGLSKRWGTTCKHLLFVNGIPLIARTVRQLKSNNLDNITLICPDSFRLVPELSRTTTISNGYNLTEDRPLLDGILRTKPLWSDKTLILLGDVCFSNDAIKLLCEHDCNYSLFGRQGGNKTTGKSAGELFAVRFLFSDWGAVIMDMENVLSCGKGKLWDLHRYSSLDIHSIDDYTDDTDSIEAYTQFWKKLEKAATKDDKDEE